MLLFTATIPRGVFVHKPNQRLGCTKSRVFIMKLAKVTTIAEFEKEYILY